MITLELVTGLCVHFRGAAGLPEFEFLEVLRVEFERLRNGAKALFAPFFA
jgi:hypothetical protein